MDLQASESTNANTYLLDPESITEMARLIKLDRFTTEAMGGVLIGLPELPPRARVLDLACGPGSWVLDVAFSHPGFEVAGVDVSHLMVKYANARATSQDLTNASFGVMDITQPLDFADNSFDLVNARLLAGLMQTTSWSKLLQEVMRILRPGGVFRLTETDDLGQTNSDAIQQIAVAVVRAGYKRGYNYAAVGSTSQIFVRMPSWFTAAGFQRIQHQAHALFFYKGMSAWADMRDSYQIAFQGLKQLITPEEMTSEQFDQLFQQMQIDFQQDGFGGMWMLLSVWGRKPSE